MAVSVQLNHVTKAFGTTLAVNDVSLKIEEGEFFFLLGPSGCGKSTFLRIVAGFYKPDTGELRFDDTVMNNVPPHQRNTGMVFQNYALWPHMSVAENIEYGLTLRKLEKEERQEKIDRALEMVQMEGYHDRAVNTLSGGQQQRIALARALVIEPSVLLLDEPISNLDAALRQQMRDEIKQIHDRTNITMFYVTHDQVDALSMADRMAIMQDGVIIQVGHRAKSISFQETPSWRVLSGKPILFPVKSRAYRMALLQSKHLSAHSILKPSITNLHKEYPCSVQFDQRHLSLMAFRTIIIVLRTG